MNEKTFMGGNLLIRKMRKRVINDFNLCMRARKTSCYPRMMQSISHTNNRPCTGQKLLF